MVKDDDIAEAYQWALSYAARQCSGKSLLEDALKDAATDAILRASRRCKNAERFKKYARATVKRAVWRARERAKQREDKLPLVVRGVDSERDADSPSAASPNGPLLIDDLPEALAFVVRLYTVDGFNLRECALLLGISTGAVRRRLEDAAHLLAPGRIAPERRKGERRLSAG